MGSEAGHSRRVVGSLGKAMKYDETTYSDGRHQVTGRFSPIAVATCAQLDGNVVEDIVIVTTEEAWRQWGGELVADATAAGLVEPRHLAVPGGQNAEQIAEIVATVAAAMEGDLPVVLDVSLGLRSFPMLFAASALISRFADPGAVDAIRYGAFDMATDGFTPILDLSWILEAGDIVDGLSRMMTGDGSRIGEFLTCRGRELGEQKKHELSKAIFDLKQIMMGQYPYVFAPLPLDLSTIDGPSRKKIAPALANLHPALSRRILDVVIRLEGITGIAKDARGKRTSNKREVVLDEDLIAQQKAVIAWTLEHGQLGAAARMMREWIVNRVLLARGLTTAEDWLAHERRANGAERRLTALGRLSQDEALSSEVELGEDLSRLQNAWETIRVRRNQLSHAGFNIDEGATPKKMMNELREAWATLESLPASAFDIAFHGSSPVVLTPLGKAPGLLHTLLQRAREQGRVDADAHLVVLGSDATTDGLAEALERCAWPRERCTEVVLRDPFRAWTEEDEVWSPLASRLALASAILFNVTGGTTGQQVLAQRLAARARGYAVPVTEVACVDVRELKAQQESPWVLGDLIEVG